jgi:hypothetical protein
MKACRSHYPKNVLAVQGRIMKTKVRAVVVDSTVCANGIVTAHGAALAVQMPERLGNTYKTCNGM